MKRFLIKVNGVAYDVEVEESDGSVTPSPVVSAAPAAPELRQAVPAMPASPAMAPQQQTQAVTSRSGSESVKAPMPGTILAISVMPGAAVVKGQVLCILEAMKMENEIVSPRDGIVAGISVAKGSSVNAGDPLISLE